MNGLLVFVILVFVLQVVLFFVIRKKRNQEKENSVIEKYKIRNSSDAFRLLQDPEIPETDRKKIEALYKGEEM